MNPGLAFDGKSLATRRLERLLNRMEQQFEAVSQVLEIPFGVQEVTMGGYGKWWREADTEARMREINQRGVATVLRMLGPDVLGRGKAGA